ncbi:protein MEI2-like 4 isoform X2 [Mangifera indica]|uniref:protein MEI2-like 4 isoform X2 n=1 Tax=Mangifera indica TaxID=29780 RepID=UPI001CF9FE8C|nr:protein MEI2-like 4 isoform X2 [Mangifera indica]
MPSEELQGLAEDRQVGFCKSNTLPGYYASRKSVASSPLDKHITVEFQTVQSLEHPESFLMRDREVNLCLDRFAVGAERAVKQCMTLLRPVDSESVTRSSLFVQNASSFVEGDKVNKMVVQHESSLFSSPLSELFSGNMRLSSNIAPHGYSVDTVASHYEEEGPFESLEEVEAQTIGNLLPNDDDLFSGVTSGLDYIIQPSSGDDMDEMDIFNSVGGMDLGDDGSSAVEENSKISASKLGVCNGAITGDHPYGEQPSRTLFVRNINSDVEDSELKILFEQYGDISTFDTACKHQGFVIISYHDIRAARNAMKALQNKLMRHRKLNIHFSIPKENPLEKDINPGTLVVFNLDASVSNEELHQIFGVYGEIKEIHETTEQGHHKFIEFYDIRAAEAALQALNRINIAGKQIKVEPSHHRGSKQSVQQCSLKLEKDEFDHFLWSSPPKNLTKFSGAILHGSVSSRSTDNGISSGLHSAREVPFLEPVHPGIPSSFPNTLPSLVRVEPVGPQSGLAESGNLQNPLKFGVQTTLNFHPQSLPEYHDVLANGVLCNSPSPVSATVNIKPTEMIDNQLFSRVGSTGHSIGFREKVFGSAGGGSGSFRAHNYTWSNSCHPQLPGMKWPNSPSMVNGICNAYSPGRLPGLLRSPSFMVNTVLPIGNHHVGSAPAVDPSLWDRQHAYVAKSPEVSGFHPGSLGSMRISNNSLHPMEYASHNICSPVGGNIMDMPIPSKNLGFQSHQQRSMMFTGGGQMVPIMHSFDLPNERARSRRNEGSVNQANKKQYELDIDRILQGEDTRTTLMIKNIPNKYTSKMLLTAIDERHKGTYDFIYLPIDFKNKCNVGYAFINMTDQSQIIPFYQSFNGKKWEKFNSEKVASLAYARIQGKAALIAHFQNSSLMNEDKKCRPILFNTDGPNAGDQVPFPTGVNVRTRPGKVWNATPDENSQGNHLNCVNGEGSSNGDSSLGSVKESD